MGDARHQRSKSDHNLGNAFDVSHDPGTGCDGSIIAGIAIQDPRTAYVIWNRRIWSKARAGEGWRRYSGKNPHTHHCHVSIRATARDDTRPWGWAPGVGAQPAAVPQPSQPTATTPVTRVPLNRDPYPGTMVRVGARGELVRRVQQQLVAHGHRMPVDGDFGPITDRAVRAFQRRHGLQVDGIVGEKTWKRLFG